VWDAAAPTLEKKLIVPLAALLLDSTTAVVRGAATELARYARATAPLVITASAAPLSALGLQRPVRLATKLECSTVAAAGPAMELAWLAPVTVALLDFIVSTAQEQIKEPP